MSRRLVIGTGGTGGHITPGVAVAEAWIARSGEVLFIGGRGGIEERLVPEAGHRLSLVPAGRVKGVNLTARLRGLVSAPRGVWAALRILNEYKPVAVVGLGGYASFATVAAANLLAIPVILCEQNTIPGATNRLLARFSDRICTSFLCSGGWFPSLKVVHTGNPVRESVAARRRACGDDTFRISVLGGSQGALFLNSEIAPVLASLAARNNSISIVHQCGTGREDEVEETYRGLSNVRIAPYVEDMAALLSETDLAISRSGATIVAELTVVGVPSILVPFPFATDNHQEVNARVVERAGGASVLLQSDWNRDRFTADLRELIGDGGRLERMSSATLSLGIPDAADRVVDVIQGVMR